MFSKKSNTFILSLINPKILFMFCLKKSAKIVSFQNYFSIFFIIITINFYQCQQRHLDVKFPLQIVFTFLHNNNIITPANFPHQRRKFYKSYYQIDIVIVNCLLFLISDKRLCRRKSLQRLPL